MIITQTNNFNGQIIEKNADNQDVAAAYLTASLDTSTQNVNISINAVQKDLLTANAADAATQFTSFFDEVATQGKALGFAIFSNQA